MSDILLLRVNGSLVVTQNRHEPASIPKLNQKIKHAFGINASVYEVAERNDRVIRILSTFIWPAMS